MFTEAKNGTIYNDLYLKGRTLFVPLDEIATKHLNDESKTSFVTDDELQDLNHECKVYKRGWHHGS
jgi:hypothetical protein